MSKSILIVATSHDQLGDTGKKTGCWAEEIIAPYFIFKEAGYNVTVASMLGGEIPIDANSMADGARTAEVDKFYADSSLASVLKESTPLAEVKGGEYDAVYLPGGHGVVYDMPDNQVLQQLIASLYDAGKVVSSVCHGPGSLVNVKLSNGKYLVDGKRVTGFSNTEEEAVGLTAAVPFLLEDTLKARGGLYSKSPQDWAVYVVSDLRLVTGQNPGSSKAVAEAVLAELGK